jgi:hypothetical protein
MYRPFTEKVFIVPKLNTNQRFEYSNNFELDGTSSFHEPNVHFNIHMDM